MTFKKGESGNIYGRPVLPPEIKRRADQIRKLTNAQIAEIGTILLECNEEDLKKVEKSQRSTVLQVWMASIVQHGIKKGDAGALNMFLDRIAGKVKEEIDLTIGPKPTIIRRIDGSEIILGTERDLLEAPEET